MSATHDIESELGFLARDTLYASTKPYDMRFDPLDDIPRDNLLREKRRVLIRDARDRRPNLLVNGFEVVNVPTSLTYDDFSSPKNAIRLYREELEAHLKQRFSASHVRVIDYQVRRRHPGFPTSSGEDFVEAQPAQLVHLDFSYEEACGMIRTLYGDQASPILDASWHLINVWRPLRGPVRDWPLAVCDSQTFSAQQDGLPTDVVYPDWTYENVLVQHSESQQWFYISDMQENESLLFTCATSNDLPFKPCPHAAFPNPNSSANEPPRESIESRAFIFYAPLDEFPEECGTIYGKQ